MASTDSTKPVLPSSLLAPAAEQRMRTLPHCATMLSLVHARHRNQHRRSHWYRHFSSFRRETIRLCGELAIPLPFNPQGRRPGSILSSHSTNAKTKRKPHRSRAEQRLQFWIDARLPHKWHRALTHLVATTQYSSLGLILLATLARICCVTGVIAALERLASTKKCELLDMAQHTLQRSEAEETELHSLLKSFAEEDAPALFNDVALVGAPTQNLQPNEVGKATNILDKGISLVRDGHHRKRRKNGPKVGKNVIDALFAEL